MSLSRLALTIPERDRLLAARLALSPIPSDWPADHTDRQVVALANGNWGIELSDHSANATSKFCAILAAAGHGNSLMSYEKPHWMRGV